MRCATKYINANTEYGASRVADFSEWFEKEDDRRFPEEIQNWSIAGNEGKRERGKETTFKHPSKAPVVSFCIIPVIDQADMIDSRFGLRLPD